MTMPKEIVFARHGQSEANVVQKHDNHGVHRTIADMIFKLLDWKHRLTDEALCCASSANISIVNWAAWRVLMRYMYRHLCTRETAAYMGGLTLAVDGR